MGYLEFEILQPQDDHRMKSAHKHNIMNTLYILISIHISYGLLSKSENTFFFCTKIENKCSLDARGLCG